MQHNIDTWSFGRPDAPATPFMRNVLLGFGGEERVGKGSASLLASSKILAPKEQGGSCVGT